MIRNKGINNSGGLLDTLEDKWGVISLYLCGPVSVEIGMGPVTTGTAEKMEQGSVPAGIPLRGKTPTVHCIVIDMSETPAKRVYLLVQFSRWIVSLD